MSNEGGTGSPARVDRRDYVPALDGFRAICITGVIVLHVGPTNSLWFEQLRLRGWFGVDAFFVLSGFLISSILLGELGRDGTIDLPRFYLRRALRLQPAYLSALVLMLTFGYLLDTAYKQQMLAAWPYFLTYTLNIAVAFALVIPPPLIIVSWSLCIEEQFYLLWPLVLRRIGEHRALRFLLWAIGVFAMYRTVLYGWLTWGHVSTPSPAVVFRIIFSTDTRIDTILAGCVLAAAIRANRPERLWATLKDSASFPTLAVVIAGLSISWLYASPTSWLYYMMGPAVAGVSFGTVIAALILHPQSWPSRALSWKPLVFVGRMSYGVYLFHMAVWSALTHLLQRPYGMPGSLSLELFEIAAVFSGAVLIAWLHHRFVERHFMAFRDRPRVAVSARHTPVDVSGNHLAPATETP